MTGRSTPSKAPRSAGRGERPPVHPLLTFQFESDTRAEPKGRRRKQSPPASIRDAITRWLDEQL